MYINNLMRDTHVEEKPEVQREKIEKHNLLFYFLKINISPTVGEIT